MERYHITGVLGDGSFGTVYDATLVKGGERVAIKRLKTKFESWSACTRLREVASLSKLRHENIVRLQEVVYSKDDGSLCFVFEFVNSNVYKLLLSAHRWRASISAAPAAAAATGTRAPSPAPAAAALGVADEEHALSDAEAVAGGVYSAGTGSGLSEASIRSIMFQLFSGLSCMHRHGFFHRDLKPENLLCDVDGSALRIADFGQARNTRSRPPFSAYVGTRWYRAPECILGLPVYNSPVDVWAAGAIMAELFAGHPVFPGANGAAQLYAIASVLGAITPGGWPEGARHCAAAGVRTGDGASSSSSGGCSSSRERLAALCTGASAAALDVVCACLQWDPAKRPSAADALGFEFFAPAAAAAAAASGGGGDSTPFGGPYHGGGGGSYTEFSGIDTPPGAPELLLTPSASPTAAGAAARDWRGSNRSPLLGGPAAAAAALGSRRPSVTSLTADARCRSTQDLRAAAAVAWLGSSSSSGIEPPPYVSVSGVGGGTAGAAAALLTPTPRREAGGALPHLRVTAPGGGEGGGGGDVDLASLASDIDTDLAALGLMSTGGAAAEGCDSSYQQQHLQRARTPEPPFGGASHQQHAWPGRSFVAAAPAASSSSAPALRPPPVVAVQQQPDGGAPLPQWSAADADSAARGIAESSFEDLLSEIEGGATRSCGGV